MGRVYLVSPGGHRARKGTERDRERGTERTSRGLRQLRNAATKVKGFLCKLDAGSEGLKGDGRDEGVRKKRNKLNGSPFSASVCVLLGVGGADTQSGIIDRL